MGRLRDLLNPGSVSRCRGACRTLWQALHVRRRPLRIASMQGETLMGKDEDDSEREINAWARRLGGSVCRQRFGWGKKKVCTKPKGHKGGHKQ